MKNFKILMFCLFFIVNYSPFLYGNNLRQQQIPIEKSKIDKLNLQKFIGKKVKLLLESSKVLKHAHYVFVDEKPGFLNCLSLEYEKNISIDVYVSNYKFTKQFDINRKWTIKTFKKEEISKIEILNNEKIIRSYH